MSLPQRRTPRPPWPAVRDAILFMTGLAGIVYEALSGLERPTLLLLYAALVGLPSFLRADERDKE